MAKVFLLLSVLAVLGGAAPKGQLYPRFDERDLWGARRGIILQVNPCQPPTWVEELNPGPCNEV